MIEKLIAIQNELKAPKGQYNSFGNYKYRSCEDILEAVKPLLKENNLILKLSDELLQIGERYYVKATATLIDESGEINNTAYAREEESKKGMDGSQITGTASSYARKYALNGLFLIDDTKDADTDKYVKTTKDTRDYKKELEKLISDNKLDKMEICKEYKLNSKSTNNDFKVAYDKLTKEVLC